MATADQSNADTSRGRIDARSYQEFWEQVSPDILSRYAGKCVALERGEDGWQIIDAADGLDELRKSLVDSGADLSNVVFDQIHTEDATAAGLQAATADFVKIFAA